MTDGSRTSIVDPEKRGMFASRKRLRTDGPTGSFRPTRQKTMPFLTEKRRGISNLFGWTFASRIVLVVFLLASSVANSVAQLPKSASPSANVGSGGVVD